ncbi:MAG: cob(I)yrinic acid a,c-diamide adenosyltransferase [Prevotella sp.]|nr:cob(I)yrinic acid a,c-diamide adenosyltransferase [Prevotella sp.]
MKITKVYTKTGDKGETSLVGGVKVTKTCCRIEAYGTIDELNSHIGLLVSMLEDDCDITMLERIQSCLFNVGTHLATDQSQTQLYSSAKLPDGEVERLEQIIDKMIEVLPESHGFVLPGGTIQASQAHVCRTVCRRAERCIIRLSEEAVVSPEIIKYINRLSDLLFVFAKKLNFIAGSNEKLWQNYCE